MNIVSDACVHWQQKQNVCHVNVPFQEKKKNGKLLFLQKKKVILMKKLIHEKMAKTKIEKVEIESLISTLVYVYNMGADFVDIIISKKEDDEADKITVCIRDEYSRDEHQPNSDPLPDNDISIINEKDIDNFFDEIS